LTKNDIDGLAQFLHSLSSETRFFWQRDGYDQNAALEMTQAIARYDKLRLIAVPPATPSRILALTEFSFDLPGEDLRRFVSYGYPADATTDCRFGPCVRDECQGRGLATLLLPPTLDTARRFGQKRIFLWGGVLQSNRRAIRFYQRAGFIEIGRFVNRDGNPCLDMILNEI
jgi:GNAT superfamily N-acetyltransferase